MPLRLTTTRPISKRANVSEVTFDGFPLGINRLVGAKQLQKGELVECLNFKFADDGRLVTRPGLRKVSTIATDGNAPITCISNGLLDVSGVFFDSEQFDSVYFDGGASMFVHYVMLADENNKIYYMDPSTGNILPIASNYTAAGHVKMTSFGGAVVIFDGSYIKYFDGNRFDVAYDDGDGTGGYQFDDTQRSDDTTQALRTGAVTRYGGSFTTQDWDAGYTIPLTTIKAVLSKTGSPTGSVYAKLYNADRSSALATSAAVNAALLTTSAVSTEFTFASTATYRMEPGTEYFLSIEYTGGSEGNTVNVHLDTVGSGKTDYYYDTEWRAGTGIPLFAVKPGRPPKGLFGVVWHNRLWFIDPDEPGWARFTNVNTIFDYSTTDGAGYIGSVDDDGKNFPIGAIQSMYGDLYLFGRKETPYVSKITGFELDKIVQEVLLQEIPADYNSCVSTINDVWFATATGVYGVRGVQEYGDVRIGEPGEPISPTVAQYFTDGAFAAFNPIDGQYWLKLDGYDRVLVGHTRRGVQVASGIRYPWTEYEFEGVTPTAFGFSIDTMYIGGDDGHLYTLDADVNDGDTQPDYLLKSCILEMPFYNFMVNRYYMQVSSEADAEANLNLYRNGGGTALVTRALEFTTDRVQGLLRFECRSLQLSMSDLVITKPLHIGGVYFHGMPMEAK